MSQGKNGDMDSQVTHSVTDGFLLPLTSQNPSRVASVHVHCVEKAGVCFESMVPQATPYFKLSRAGVSPSARLAQGSSHGAQTRLHGR